MQANPASRSAADPRPNSTDGIPPRAARLLAQAGQGGEGALEQITGACGDARGFFTGIRAPLQRHPKLARSNSERVFLLGCRLLARVKEEAARLSGGHRRGWWKPIGGLRFAGLFLHSVSSPRQ
jgi:hypothetical protein